jgi:hypothetical protein
MVLDIFKCIAVRMISVVQVLYVSSLDGPFVMKVIRVD